jgi:hypothetical protein
VDALKQFRGWKLTVAAYIADPEGFRLAIQIHKALSAAGIEANPTTTWSTSLLEALHFIRLYMLSHFPAQYRHGSR